MLGGSNTIGALEILPKKDTLLDKFFLLQRPKEYVQIGINHEFRTNYKVYYKIKDIVNFLYSLKDTKYKVQAKNTLLKIQKFWIENNDTKMLELLTDDIKNFIGNYKKLK